MLAVEAYKLIREFNPKEMPELKMPKAKVSELSGGGKLYTYPLPKKWGVDPQVAVNAGLTDKFVAVSTMPQDDRTAAAARRRRSSTRR